MDFLKAELADMHIAYKAIDILQDKDGVVVARIQAEKCSYILKCFQNPAYRREIGNYRLLSSLHIPTLDILAATGTALLMEDIGSSPLYRLATEADMDDPEIAVRIAAWYRSLHRQGYRYLAENSPVSLYDENDCITPENIALIKARTGTADLPVWRKLEDSFSLLMDFLRDTRRTLTYNDFYYTNMVVAKDRTAALMFDYNLLGKGYAYADIRNVCSSLSPAAREAFLAQYGPIDRQEIILDEVACVLTTLYAACQRPQFPAWANGVLTDLQTNYADKIDRLLKLT